MPIVTVADFETRSRLDLNETNVYKYAQHSSTEVLVFCWTINNGPIHLWRPGEPYPFDRQSDLVIEAFNGEFELCIWNYVCVPKYGWPPLKPAQISCLQARASYCGLPRKLDQCSRALDLGDNGKDAAGHKIMLELCKPKKAVLVGCEYRGGEFIADPDKHRRNEDYCGQDVEAERIVSRQCPPLPPIEQKLWLVHQRINHRGVPVDLAMCKNATWMVRREFSRLNCVISKMTDGKITAPTQLQRIKDWSKEQGYFMPSMTEESVIDAIAHPSCPQNVRDLLRTRQLTRDASVAKFPSILNHADHDARCRAAHVFYKAGPGRFAGSGVNFLNLRRLIEDETPAWIALADEIATANDPLGIYERLRKTELGVIPTLGALPRLAVCAAPGKKLAFCDYAGIEYRMIHWMAGDQGELDRIRKFDAGEGPDPYKVAAATIYEKSIDLVTRAERQVGKVQRLGCQYLSGAEKFQAFCAGYGIDMPLDRAQDIVQLYRRSVPLVKNFWYCAGKAACKAVRDCVGTYAGPFQFYMTGNTLNARLPSGREMKYYDAALVEGNYGDEIEALDQRTGMRKTVGLPVLIENLDQGASRDLLLDALIKCDQERLPVVLHVYDEIVLEVDANDDKSGAALRDIMRDVPRWAKGLPVDANLVETRRYTK